MLHNQHFSPKFGLPAHLMIYIDIACNCKDPRLALFSFDGKTNSPVETEGIELASLSLTESIHTCIQCIEENPEQHCWDCSIKPLRQPKQCFLRRKSHSFAEHYTLQVQPKCHDNGHSQPATDYGMSKGDRIQEILLRHNLRYSPKRHSARAWRWPRICLYAYGHILHVTLCRIRP